MNHSIKKYRDQGAIGALLDEYEKAIQELQTLIKPIASAALTNIVDPDTTDQDCKSIQTILSHVVRSGYVYAIYARNHSGEQLPFPERVFYRQAQDYIDALDNMFAYNVRLFEDYPNIPLAEADVNKKIHVSWNNYFDVEQLMEHAIVHILRHRRQIERFLLKM